MKRFEVARRIQRIAKALTAASLDEETKARLDKAEKQGKKYILLKKEGGSFWRIMACKNFKGVKKGDIGGLIESEKNLDQKGNCWISGDAKVFDNAKVYGDAWIEGEAVVRDNAQVYAKAEVYGKAEVKDNAKIYGNAQVCGYAIIADNAKVCDAANVYGRAEVYGNSLLCSLAKVDYIVNGQKIEM